MNMRLVSFGHRGFEQAGVVTGDSIVPVENLDVRLPRTVRELLDGHLPRVRTLLDSYNGQRLSLSSTRLGPPITNPSKIICIGLNYRDHATEQGTAWPEYPLLFSKAPNTLAGPTDAIELPAGDGGPDYEVELAVVIGQRCKRVAASAAQQVIAGYMIGNDVTCRRWQKTDGQWFRAKSSDTFYPCGPALVTADEIRDPSVLRLTTTIGNDVLQDGIVSNLIHDIPALIAWITSTITLEVGDIISTGTPAGVGCYRKPPRFLTPGETVICAINGAGIDLGQLSNPVIDAAR